MYLLGWYKQQVLGEWGITLLTALFPLWIDWSFLQKLKQDKDKLCLVFSFSVFTISLNQIFHDNNYKWFNINRQFVVLHTCTQTLFHTRHSHEMQEIFRCAHNKRQYFIEPFLMRSVRCKRKHFWRWFRSSPLVLSHLTTAVVWQWQQVCDQISNLRLYYIDSGTQHHNKMIF